MSNPTIKVKRSTVQGKVPTTGQLGLGEIAINHYDGKIFVLQDTGGVGVGTTVISVGSIDDWQIKTSNYTASNGDKLIADTSGGSFTITLPPSPYTGFNIKFADGDDWSNNNLTISRNGSTIEDISDNLILDVSDTIVTLIYDGSTWQVFSQVGAQGPPGPSYWVETNAGIHTLSNVGIGTTNPTQKLQVYDGAILINGAASPNLNLSPTDGLSGNGDISFDGTNFTIVSNSSSASLVLGTNSASRLTITSTGNVGIGATNPDAKLQINTVTGTTGLKIVSVDTNGFSDLDINSVGTTGSSRLFFSDTAGQSGSIIYNHSDNSLNFATNGGTTDVKIDSSGNVGIGTDNPAAKLDVNGDVFPTTDAAHDLGSASKRWANIYSADLQLSNEGSQNDVDGTWGAYTIQEGEDDLFLLNRRNGKKYKFVLQEVN